MADHEPEGRAGLCSQCVSRVCSHAGCNPAPRLTPRQAELILLLGKGLNNADIAAVTRYRYGTIKQMLAQLFAELRLANRLELAMWGHRHREELAAMLDAIAFERSLPKG